MCVSDQPSVAEVTVDSFLGGLVEAVQPAAGHHRAGLEAVLLAAAVSATTTGAVVELGAGVGVAGFCVAARCANARVVLVEGDATAAQCARDALLRGANQSFAGRVEVIESDIRARVLQAGQVVGSVIFNPPFLRWFRLKCLSILLPGQSACLGAGWSRAVVSRRCRPRQNPRYGDGDISRRWS